MHIRGAKCLRGEIVLPGDKSISHRAAMLGAIAAGRTRIENYAASEDCASTIECLRQLGVTIEREGSRVIIHGVGKKGLRAPDGPLDCGNSGTTMRLLAGILAGQDFDSVLTGDDSLRGRPMRRIAEPLTSMGARVETTDGHAPLKISGGRTLRGIEHNLTVASAQVKSCILLAGLFAGGETAVVEPVQTRDHTERMLRRFGVRVERTSVVPSGQRYSLSGDSELVGCDYVVPGDISAAAFFLVAAACIDGSDITMRHVGLNPTRADIIRVLKGFGARIDGYEGARTETPQDSDTEPTGDIRVRSGFDTGEPGGSHVIGGKLIPKVIDEIPVLGVLGTQLSDGIEVRDAAELRIKESDRISAVVENLKRMNADVEEFNDGFRVHRSRLSGARVDSYGDHRIAMAFSVAGLLAEGETDIDGAECAAVSFPGFFAQLQNVAIYE